VIGKLIAKRRLAGTRLACDEAGTTGGQSTAQDRVKPRDSRLQPCWPSHHRSLHFIDHRALSRRSIVAQQSGSRKEDAGAEIASINSQWIISNTAIKLNCRSPARSRAEDPDPHSSPQCSRFDIAAAKPLAA
jgi:hypothetical protein